jgi:hypothetical protein
MDYENKNWASKGVAGAGLGTGIAGLSLGVLNALGNGGLLNGILGGGCGCAPACSENMPVSRYEAELNQKNAAQESEIALLKADAYTNQKFADLNDRYNDRFRTIEQELARNAVKQQATDDSIMLVNERLECCKANIMERLCREIDDRKCGDNTIVNYLNATFYAKQVADVTTGTTTTAQAVYNPLPIQCCKC